MSISASMLGSSGCWNGPANGAETLTCDPVSSFSSAQAEALMAVKHRWSGLIPLRH